MKFFFDFFPVLFFFLSYKFFGSVPTELIALANQIPWVEIDQSNPKDAMFFATVVIIFATLLQNIVHYFVYRHFEKMHLISLGLLIILGSATVIMKDAQLLVWKVTIINWLFALVFLGSQFFGEKTVVERLMGQAFIAKSTLWIGLNLAWVVFFILIGLVNLYVFFQFGEDSWVNFKFYGLMGATFAFVIAQSVYLFKYATVVEVDESSKE
jgi:intracellular septation protein